MIERNIYSTTTTTLRKKRTSSFLALRILFARLSGIVVLNIFI